ncbi:rhodanese-like domain-containing protein [Nodosilinea nodulosa]|uniref:rhodanese-like domain-containing protein n=1 Tax=Nodosilinea nodulosa TaxID=416001 RepID=UPI0018C20D8C|nr:rhodanese-like domain-containing protein [Nodosilinea nodulosa]
MSPMLTPATLLRSMAWWVVDHWVRRTYPEVPTLTTQQLADWLREGKAPVPILLDVRRECEYSVSHLPGAERAASLEAALALGLDPAQPIVAYCAVGYRSARLAAQLRQAGYGEVYNLAGSIFRWANEGRSLVRGGQPAAAVHPYSPRWGLLLRPGLAQGQNEAGSAVE